MSRFAVRVCVSVRVFRKRTVSNEEEETDTTMRTTL